MPLYLTKFSYTPETWARLIGNPEDRRKAAQSYIESVGGKLHGFWYAFGAHGGYNLWEAPVGTYCGGPQCHALHAPLGIADDDPVAQVG